MKIKDIAIALGYFCFELLVFLAGLLMWRINKYEGAFLFDYFGEIVVSLSGLGAVLFLYLFIKGIANPAKADKLRGQFVFALCSIIFPFLMMGIILSHGH